MGLAPGVWPSVAPLGGPTTLARQDRFAGIPMAEPRRDLGTCLWFATPDLSFASTDP